ncbi:hypothetical protein ACG0Z6_05680 [Roseateles sp. BYS180W]|uniref:Uncharacterized protein n=1 Tax=Roseateles rivi TaxID=3299028 RepID=A0ABW7FTX0_9BURK
MGNFRTSALLCTGQRVCGALVVELFAAKADLHPQGLFMAKALFLKVISGLSTENSALYQDYQVFRYTFDVENQRRKNSCGVVAMLRL